MRLCIMILVIFSLSFGKNHSLTLGIDENINLLSLRNDYSLAENSHLYISVGFGLGFSGFFTGFKYDPNPRNFGNSYTVGLGFSDGGRDRNDEREINKVFQASIFRKLIVNESNKSFLNVGFTYWKVINSKSQPINFLPVISYSINF